MYLVPDIFLHIHNCRCKIYTSTAGFVLAQNPLRWKATQGFLLKGGNTHIQCQLIMDRLSQLEQLLAQSPADSFLLFAIAKEYEGRGHLAEALKYYETLVAADPAYVGVYYHLGKLQERLEQAAVAFASYTKGMEIARSISDQHAYNELAAARLQLGDEEDFAG